MEWRRGVLVGRGSFGAVHIATVATPGGGPAQDGRGGSTTPQVMAVKSSLLADSVTLLREKEVLDRLAGCPEVVACYGDDVTLEADGRRVYNVFLDYVPGGTLWELCRRTPLTEEDVRRYAAAILRALRWVHESGCVHCDVKPQNVLVAGNGRGKLADFGLAKRVGEKYAAAGGGAGVLPRGTAMYLAPETVVSGEQGPPSDIWSLGCTVTEMARGQPPWRCADAAALIYRIGCGGESPAIPEGMSDQGKDFLRRCLERDPAERWTAEMLLEHPFIAAAKEDDDIEKPGPSPRSILEFPRWASVSSPTFHPASSSSSANSPENRHPSPADRLRQLIPGSPQALPLSRHSLWDDDFWILVRQEKCSSKQGTCTADGGYPRTAVARGATRGHSAAALPTAAGHDDWERLL